MRSEKGRVDDGVLLTHVLATLGFACLLGWELSLVFAPALPLLGFVSVQEAIALRVVSVLALALALVLCARAADWVFLHRTRLFVVGACLVLVAVVNTAVAWLFGGEALVVSVVVWALVGFAQASMMMYWCTFLSLIPPRWTPLTVALGSVVGTTLFVLINSSGIVWVNLLGIVVMLVASVGIAAFLSRRIPSENVLAPSEYRRSPILSVPASLSVACHGAVYGFMVVELCSMGFEAALAGGASGIVGTLFVVAWSVLGAKVDIDTGVVQRMSLPPLVASVLLLPLFSGPARVACACLAIMALAHSTLFVWYSTCVENYEFRLHPVHRFAVRQVPSWMGFFVGSVFAYMLTFTLRVEGVAPFAVMAVFAVVVVTVFSVYGGDESKTKERLDKMLASDLGVADDDSLEKATPLPRFKQNCACVTERYALTPREAEVFPLLAKGRNAAYIADHLGVSPATVKSHIYHIYQKLGINSQQNLIDVVDACDKPA